MPNARPPACPRCHSHYVNWAIVSKHEGRIKRVWACKGCELLFTPTAASGRLPLILIALSAAVLVLLHYRHST